MGQKTVNGVKVEYTSTDSDTGRNIKVTDVSLTANSHYRGSPTISFKIGSTVLASYTAPTTNDAELVAARNNFYTDLSKKPSATITKTHSTQKISIVLSVFGESSTSTTTVPAKTSYTITYNANGGSGAPSAQTKWYGESLTLSSSKPTRTGYTFKGWGTSNSATSASYQPGGNYTVNSGTTLYAVWQINTYTVSYANGGRGTAPASQTKTYGTNLPLRAGLGVVSNYRFSKWKATDGTLYDGSGTYSKNAATTMTAQWIAPYTVSYNGNGATGGSTSAQTKVHDTDLALRSNGFAYTNYTFAGWNTKSDGSGTSYSAGQTYKTNANVTLYAQWTQIYASPTLTISKTYRADSSGIASDEGTYLTLEANYSIYPGNNNAVSSWLAECNGVTETVPVSGGSDSSGTVKFILPANLSVESSYPITLTLTDTNGGASGLSSGTITKTATLGVAAYPLDAQRFEDDGSYGVAIGGLSTRKGFDVFPDTYFRSANIYLDNVGDHYFIFPNTNTSGEPTITHRRIVFTGYGNLRLDTSTNNGQEWTLGTKYFAQAMAGIIQMFAGATAPDGWLICDGSAVSRTTYATLFAAIGTTWGAGDGSTTFNLPDLRGRAPIGAGTGSSLTARTLGGKGGAETVKLTDDQSGLPAHTHGFTNPKIPNHVHTMDHGHGFTQPKVNRTQNAASGSNRYAIQGTDNLVNVSAHSGAVKDFDGNTGNPTSLGSTTGGSVGAVTGGAKDATNAHNNMQPFAVVNFIICTGKTS